MSILIRRLILGRAFSENSRNIFRLGLAQCDLCVYHNLKYRTFCKESSHGVSTSEKPGAENITEESEKYVAENKKYHIFYRLPQTQILGAVSKSKKIFTFTSIGVLPLALGLNLVDIISADTVFAFGYVGFLTCVPLYMLSIVPYKLVGAIYLSMDNSTVKVSYLDFWGNRVDMYCPVSDVVPLLDLQHSPDEIYVDFMRYSELQTLKLSLRFGNILDKELFTKVFGSLE